MKIINETASLLTYPKQVPGTVETRNTLTQASKNGRKPYLIVPSEEICKRVLCNKHI